ncbi:MAG: TonB-dependent receptor [Proteobacteria bacterium]|nr:TonB-dependent receptor [Pseudomonadota bacterium]
MNRQKPINQSIYKQFAVIIFAGLFGASSAGVYAQGGILEEIIVTAQKRAESVQDIGLSVQAFDAEGLTRAGITDVSRLSFLVAGLVYATAGNDAKFNLRGANSTNTFRDNPSIVGTYVDGVYKAKASQQTRAFFDVERLEFLKGPQGTLYGRNTFAGALNLHTNKPNTEKISGGLRASYERYDTIRTEAFVNLPVSDTFAVRVAGYTENGDGYIKNTAGPNAGAPDSLGMRISALFEPSDNLDILLRYSYIEEQGTSAGLFGYKNICRKVDAQGLTDAFGSVTDCQNPHRGTSGAPLGSTDEYEIAQDFLPDNDLSEHMFSVEINWDAGPVTVKSITSYTDFENQIPFDFDYSGTPHDVGGFDEFVESFTQEIVVSSNYDSAFQWTAGTYYSKDEYFNAFWIFSENVADDSVRPTVTIQGSTLTVLNGTPLVDGSTVIGAPFADSNYIDDSTYAVFFQGEYSVSDALRLIAGTRYNYEEKDAHGGGSNFTAGGAPVTFIAAGAAQVPRSRLEAFSFDEFAAGANAIGKTYSNVGWRAGLEYDVNDDMMFYFTASTGFLSGALNNDATLTDEQESQMYEIGIKSILMDGTLMFNLAGHYTEYTNLVAQLQTPTPGGRTVTTTRNGGDIKAKGIELELQYKPTAELSLGLTAAWLDAEFGEFGQTSPYQLTRGVLTVFESVEGLTPGWSPDLVFNLIGEYTIDLGENGTLTPAVMFAYSSDYNTSNLYTPDPSVQQDSYTKTDLRLTWRSASGKYAVAAYIENIEDEAVLSRSNNGSQDNIQTGYLYPQNYGISFQGSWD